MTKLLIEVIGEDVAAFHLKEVAERALDLRPAFTKIRGLLIEGNKRQFASKGSYFGSTWPPLDSATVERKGSTEALVATGALKASVTGGGGSRSGVGRSSVFVGTSLWYAHFADSGTKNEPARKLVGIAASEIGAAKEILQDYLIHGLI